jgi:3-oxoacyl-[acyl-carrier protein] reductase
MSKKNRGAMVNLSSVAALIGLEMVPHYSAVKGAILAFTRAAARDVASRGIRVNAICSGYIDTPMTERMSPLIRAAVLARSPLHRVGEPHEVAATALFLTSDDSSFSTRPWLSPNGGLFIG